MIFDTSNWARTGEIELRDRFLMDEAGVDDLLVHVRGERGRQHGGPVVLPLGIAHGELSPGEIDVFDSQRQRFEESQSRADRSCTTSFAGRSGRERATRQEPGSASMR